MERIIETYQTSGGLDVGPGRTPSGYSIEVDFHEGLSPSQIALFKGAARKWTSIISGKLPSADCRGRTVSGLLIDVMVAQLDELQGVLAQSAITLQRADTLLPIAAEIVLDLSDVAVLEADGRLVDLMVHEIGHCLGFGTLWVKKKLIPQPGAGPPNFVGKEAMREYGLLCGGGPRPVPVEDSGYEGSRNCHWKETAFGQEVMTGWIRSKIKPVSRLTAASLADLGYGVKLAAADDYRMPDVPFEGRTEAAAPLGASWESYLNQSKVLQ